MPENAAPANHPLITYRVQDLPAACDKTGASFLIEAAVGLTKGFSDIVVHSLADDPCYSTSRTATITSRDLRGVLPDAAIRDRWTFDLPYQSHGSNTGKLSAAALTIDTHFEGFTPLDSFTEDSAHQYEYVASHWNVVALRDNNLPYLSFSCIAIPGLGGNAFSSFKERGGKHMWLRDSLPAHLQGVRVLTYGYDSMLAGSQSFQDLEALASAFRRAIIRVRRQATVSLSPALT
jgi:hypothetical protein